MSDIALMWHGSLQWGRREVEEWHFLAEIYSRSLDVLEKLPDVRLTLQFGGQDIEWLSHTHPEFIERVKHFMARGQVEVAAGGYSHNFQGATPLVNTANLMLAQEACCSVFGVRAAGYWPAESMLNRGMPLALKQAGFEYAMFDSLNIRNSGAREYDLFGSYHLEGAFGETIPGLPQCRFTDCTRRGEGAGIMPFALGPSYYNFDPAIILDRVKRVPLVVEISDWEHFNMREDKALEIHMGTSSIGSSRNAVDPEKIAAWETILVKLIESGHRFLTCRESLKQHPPSETLDLIDGRDYTKNDLTRLVDACAWHGSDKGGLSGRKDPHHMSDQESYSYSFTGAHTLQQLIDILQSDSDAAREKVKARTKDVCISFCSAHRSGGEDFTVKQQVLDRINRVINDFHVAVSTLQDQSAGILFPVNTPAGAWPVHLNLPSMEASASAILVSETGQRRPCFLEHAETEACCFKRTHRLWLDGPVDAGKYSVQIPGSGERLPDSVEITETDTCLKIENSDSMIKFDKLNSGIISGWEVKGFSPFVHAGSMEFSALWQDAPLCDEVSCAPKYTIHAAGVTIDFSFSVEGIRANRRHFVDKTLKVCQSDVTIQRREFIRLVPFRYRLDPDAFGPDAKLLMIAEGCSEISAESPGNMHNVHHLGSELLGFSGKGGVASISVNRLVSSPILFRNPWSGAFVLMDSRPVGHADEAFAYSFARNPVFEATLRVEPGTASGVFEQWQDFQTHQPVVNLKHQPVGKAGMDWMKPIKHITEVNPYF